MPVTCNTSSPNLAKFNKHNNIFLRSHKHYAVIVFLEKLQKYKKWISNYKHFSGKDEVYNDFLNKLMKVVQGQQQLQKSNRFPPEQNLLKTRFSHTV